MGFFLSTPGKTQPQSLGSFLSTPGKTQPQSLSSFLSTVPSETQPHSLGLSISLSSRTVLSQPPGSSCLPTACESSDKPTCPPSPITPHLQSLCQVPAPISTLTLSPEATSSITPRSTLLHYPPTNYGTRAS
ncbi:hypothetical protein E2C01_072127 [Portunus trituberculatus]|uniref:Uncharacterized protein n=1 Tax=Portunus trituberculatus TaxID=210409 RepID=A0A5B7I9W7_PORTR|nr:hypothetical protein [Portunus trituberculatus]